MPWRRSPTTQRLCFPHTTSPHGSWLAPVAKGLASFGFSLLSVWLTCAWHASSARTARIRSGG